MWFPVVWIIVAALTAHVANERGRSSVAWFLAALFVSFVAILTLMALPILPKVDRRPSPQQVSQYRLRQQRF